MKKNKTNQEDFKLRAGMVALLLLFWGGIICQIIKATEILILCVILYSIINIYTCYKVLEKTKNIIQGAIIMESLLLVPVLIIVIIQAVI